MHRENSTFYLVRMHKIINFIASPSNSNLSVEELGIHVTISSSPETKFSYTHVVSFS